MLEFIQADIITRTIIVLSSLAGIAWGIIGLKLHISRGATLYFCIANFAIALAYVLALVCTPVNNLVNYFQAFNWTDVLLLAATMLIHSGLRKLYRVYVKQTRARLAFGLLILLGCVPIPGLQMGVAMLVLLASAWYALSALMHCNQALGKHFTLSTRLMLIWPLAAASLLFFMRVIDDSLALLQTHDEIDHYLKTRFLVTFIWVGLLITILLNASLIGLTLNKLFKSLNDQANRLQHILDTAPVGVSIHAGGKVRFANPCATRMLDLAVDDESSRMLVHPEDQEKILHQLKVKGTVNNMEIRMYSPQKAERDILVTYLTTHFDDEAGILGWMIDITERKHADRAIRQANREQNAIFDSATLGIAFIKNDTVVRANQRLESLFAWDTGTMVGQSPQIWWGNNGPDNASPESDPYQDIERGAIHNSTRKFRRKDGSMFWCRISGSAIDVNDWHKGTVWMFDDVTVERNALQMVRQSKEIAEDATRMKSNFLANMSHEIRTPMNAIIGMTHLALKTELTPKQKNYIEKADAAARNLLGIINDILDFSRIEAGKMHFEEMPFDLDEVLENLADICTAKAQDKGLELLFDIGPDVPTSLIGDPLRLGQVVLNLVGNAIKFTQTGEITLGIHMASGKLPANPDASSNTVCLRFDITDTGIGLTQEEQNKLFSAFSQADTSTTRKYGGAGLGLSICKRLVELMHGQIGVKSAPGLGSTFHFTAHFGRQEHQRPALLQDQASDNLRILVVDDNARAREIMLAMLASQKFAASAAGSGTQAILALKEAHDAGQPYGLVLIDWIMPGLDGLATISEIRAEPVLHDLPAFMMVTAHNQDELLEQAQGIKINGLLQKPVNPSALLDTILSVLGKELFSYGRKQRRRVANYDAEAHLQGVRLLLVEDNPVNQELALEILQQGGMRIDVASNGAQALDMLLYNTYDGILMDCQMPIMDGFEATRKIRAQARFAKLPILAMTANAMSSDRDDCLAAGMNDHIGKPIDVDQLFATLARWIKPSTPQGNDKPNRLAKDAPKDRLNDRSNDRPNDRPKPSIPSSPMLDAMPATAELASLSQIPGLDLALAMRRMRGNDKLMRKLIDRFVETQADAMTRIKTALDAKDLPSAMREAHSLKGLAGNIGASQLQSCAGALEAALKHGEPITPALEKMAQELLPLIAQISAALGATQTGMLVESEATPHKAEHNQPQDWQQALRQTLPELAELLSHDDTGSVALCERISEPLRNLGQGAALEQLNRLMSKYQFEEALGIVKTLARAFNISLRK